MVTAAMKLKDACSLEGVMTNLDSILKSKDITGSSWVGPIFSLCPPPLTHPVVGLGVWTASVLRIGKWCRREGVNKVGAFQLVV